jgi:NADH oxidase (H2O-forming)
MAIEKADWYKNNKVNLLLNTKVISLDSNKKEIKLDTNDVLTYDSCIIATGASCFIPPMPGSDLPEVVAIRSVKDIEKITTLLPTINNVVVIGGGVLGLEAAWEMAKTKKNVTVLELLPHLMPRQLDEGASNLIRTAAESNNIKLQTNVKIKGIVGTLKVEGVELDNGEIIPADLVIVSAGVRANTKLAEEAGCKINRAIVVNEKMETSVSNIYAAGDCAEFENINYALWSEAVAMGVVAGANAAGDDVTYTQVVGALSFFGLNTNLYAVGDTGKNPELKYKTSEIKDDQKGSYEKLFFANNMLTGFILVGDMKKMKILTDALNEKKTFEQINK